MLGPVCPHAAYYAYHYVLAALLLDRGSVLARNVGGLDSLTSLLAYIRPAFVHGSLVIPHTSCWFLVRLT